MKISGQEFILYCLYVERIFGTYWVKLYYQDEFLLLLAYLFKRGSITFGQNLALESAQKSLTSTPISPFLPRESLSILSPSQLTLGGSLLPLLKPNSPAGPSFHSSLVPLWLSVLVYWLQWPSGPTVFLQSFPWNPAKLIVPRRPQPRGSPLAPPKALPPRADPAR